MKLDIVILCLMISVVSCQIPGGWNKIDVDTIPDVVIDAAKLTLTNENISTGSFMVTEATSQVVSGWNYKFTVTLDNNVMCKFFIFYSWNRSYDVREHHCAAETN